MEDHQLILKGIFPVALKLLNILIHTVGFYLLVCLHKRCNENVQIIYIMNLSATELILNIFSFIRNLLRAVSPVIVNSNWFKELTMYSYLIDYTLFRFCLYMWMFYITIDRVCGVLLNMSYPNYWNSTKATYLVLFTWLFGFIVSIPTALVYGFYSNQANVFLIGNYCIIVFDITFVVVAVVSYGSIFHVFQKQRHNSLLGKSGMNSNESLWTIFRHSRFYVSVLIVSTFIVFTIIPDFMWTFHVVENEHSIEGFMLSTSYAVSYFIDGAIYIFMDDKVKRLLLKKLRIYTCLRFILSKDVRRDGTGRTCLYTKNDAANEDTANILPPSPDIEKQENGSIDPIDNRSDFDDGKDSLALITPDSKNDDLA